MLVKDADPLKIKPKLTGRPGMVIDLDGTGTGSKKLTGVELLKERFTYFATLKTPEELERDREKKYEICIDSCSSIEVFPFIYILNCQSQGSKLTTQTGGKIALGQMFF